MNEIMEDTKDLAKNNMEDPEYDLNIEKNYHCRGIVVVFNHEKFDIGLEPRSGTAKDVARLQTAFKARGFLVTVHNDKSHAEIKSTLKNVSKAKREAYGSVVVVVLSHGKDGGQIAAKDKFYSASDLRDPFLDNPAFKNKPLIFLHQACRGKYKEAFASRKSPSAFGNGDVILSGQNDILLAFGTLEGHESFRNKEQGSFYIQKMCDILEKVDDIEILDLLSATNCAVIEGCAEEKEGKGTFDKVQTATFKSSLLKRFILRKCSTNVAKLQISTSDEIEIPVECYVPQPECNHRGPAIIFHDENHKSEAIEFLESLKELNFSCQTVDHEPTDRELKNLSGNLHLEDCSCLFIGIFFADKSRLNALHSRLLEYLNNNSCSYMNKKPKIFLLACKEGATVKKGIKMDDVKSNRQVTCYSDILAIYGYSTNFLKSFAANLEASKGSDVIASVRFAQRHTAQEIDRPCNVIMCSTLRFRVDWSKQMLVHDDNALKVSSVFTYHLRDPVANFQYRTAELEVLQKVLQNCSAESRRYSVNVWISGFGGLGKSQTVLQHIMLACKQNIYQNILWINGSSPDSIRSDVQNIAESLVINLPVGGTLNDKLKRFYSKITDYGKTLLVIDNMDNWTKEQIINVLPKDHDKNLLRIIVTSVQHVENFIKLSSKVEKCISISPFSREESREFITKNLKTVEGMPESLIDTLGEELSYFPLGLQLAVGLANEQMESRTSPTDVVENIIVDMQTLQKSSSQTKGYNKSLYDIVSCTLEHLKKEKKDELALQYLKMISFCEPENIPSQILFKSTREGDERKAVKKLIALQIITNNHNLYSIHRIVQNIVYDSLCNSEEQKYILLYLMQNVEIMQNKFQEYPNVKQYILHAAKVCNSTGNFPDLYTHCKDCIKLISSELQLVGWYEDAEKFNSSHLKFSYEMFGYDSKQYSDLLLHKVQVLQILQEYEEALSWIAVLENLEPYTGHEPLDKKAYFYTGEQKNEIRCSNNTQKVYTFSGEIENFGAEFKELTRISSDDTNSPVFVSHELATQGKFFTQANIIRMNVGIQKARILQSVGKINDALEVTKNLLQPDLSFDVRTMLDFILVRADLLEEMGKLDEALEHYDRALEIRKLTPKASIHYDSIIKNNRVCLLIEMKRYEEAKKILSDLVTEYAKYLGEDHHETFNARITFSTLLFRMGEKEEALKYINEILRDIGDNNKNILSKLNALENKSIILAGLENFSGALEIMQDVHKQRLLRFGGNDLKTYNDMYMIAYCHKKNHDLQKAMNWLEDLLLKQRQRRTENPIGIMRTQIELSTILLCLGEYGKAMDLEKNIFEMQRQIYGERHYKLSETMRMIAKILYMQGKYVNALQKCENAIEILDSDNQERIANGIIKLKELKGAILIANKQFVEALTTLQDAMQFIQSSKIIKPKIVVAVKNSISNVLSKLGQFDDALSLCEEVLDHSTEIFGYDHLETTAVRNNKAYILHCVGRNTQALSEIETVEKLREQLLGVTNAYTLHTKYFKGLILSDLAKHNAALSVFSFVLDHRRRLLGEDHPEVFHTIHHRAKVLLNMGRNQEALTEFSGLFEAEKRKYGLESEQATCSMNSIATCYERMGQTFEAVEMYSAALQILEGILGPSHPNVEIVRANRDTAVQKFIANLQH